MTEITTDEALKVGARNSRDDAARLQLIHDYAVDNGAKCGAEEHSEHEPEGADVDGNYQMKGVQRGSNPANGTSVSATYTQSPVNDFALAEAQAQAYAIDPTKYLVAPGGAIKALGQMPDGGLRVGGYLVRFGSENKTDISGERDYFTRDTDFGDAKSSDVYYNHRMPVVGKDGEEIIVRRRFGKGSLSVDDVGVFIEAVTFNRDAYEQVLNNGIKATLDKHGWSSGTAAHLVDREPRPNGANWIRKWPLGLDASLTPTPAEPTTSGVIPLKSLNVGSLPPGWDALVNAAPDGAEANTKTLPTTPNLGADMATEFESQVLAALAGINTKFDTQAKEIDVLKSKVNEPQLPPAQPVSIPDGAVKAGNITEARDLEAEKPYKSIGEQLISIKDAAMPGHGVDKRLLHIKEAAVKATGASESGTEGFLLQRDFIVDLQTRMYGTGTLLGMTRNIPISSASNGIKMKMVKEPSRATGSRWGGVRTYWVEEGGTITVSNSDYRLFELNLVKLGGLYVATEEVLQDISVLSSYIPEQFANELRFTAEDAIVEGNGTGKPMGLTNSAAKITVTKETGQAAATVVYANILKMWNRMWAPLRQNAVWLVHQDVEPQLQMLALPVGTAALEPRFVTYGPDGGLRIFNRPVMTVEYCSTLGTEGDIILTNLGEYLTITKGGIQAANSIHAYFSTGEEAFRWIWRMNGKSPWEAALTPFKGSNTTSPIITLQTRS